LGEGRHHVVQRSSLTFLKFERQNKKYNWLAPCSNRFLLSRKKQNDHRKMEFDDMNHRPKKHVFWFDFFKQKIKPCDSIFWWKVTLLTWCGFLDQAF
jgi:hypothetical protein